VSQIWSSMVVIRAPNSTPMVRTEVVDRLEALVGELQQQAQLANACLLRRIAGSSGQAERKPISDR